MDLNDICLTCGSPFVRTEKQVKRCDHKCKACVSAYFKARRQKRKAEGRPVVTKYRDKAKERQTVRAYQSRPEVKARNREKAKQVYQTPEGRRKILVRAKTKQAVRMGRIVQEPCVACGSPNSEVHHPDYSQPMLVMWLCRPCHAAEHVRLKREAKQRERQTP